MGVSYNADIVYTVILASQDPVSGRVLIICLGVFVKCRGTEPSRGMVVEWWGSTGVSNINAKPTLAQQSHRIHHGNNCTICSKEIPYIAVMVVDGSDFTGVLAGSVCDGVRFWWGDQGDQLIKGIGRVATWLGFGIGHCLDDGGLDMVWRLAAAVGRR